ncbi:MAG: glycosyltransferase family 39 protein [Candidatus Aenigmatarchaeota archaeon]
MEKQRLIIITLVCLMVVGIIIRLWPFDMPYSLDEASYISLAEGIINHGEYGWIDGLHMEGQRAPLLSFLLVLPELVGGMQLTWLVMPLISVLSIAILYVFLGKRDKEAALFAAAALAVSTVNLFLSQRVLAENLVCLLLIADVFVFVNALKDRRWLIPFAVLTALTFLARYDAIAGLLPLPVYLVWKEKGRLREFFSDRAVWSSVAVFFVVLAPWALHSFFNFGNAVGAATTLGSAVRMQPLTVNFLVQTVAVMGFMLPFVVVGLLRVRNDIVKVTAVMAASYIIFHGLLIPSIRYLAPLTGLFAILAAFGVTGWRWKGAKTVFVLLAVGSLFVGTYYMFMVSNPSATDDWLLGALHVTRHDVSAFQEYREAAGLLTGEGPVITTMPSIAHLYTGKQVFLLPENETEFQQLADRTGSKYVYLHETPTLPDWVRRLPLVYDGEWVKVYEVLKHG